MAKRERQIVSTFNNDLIRRSDVLKGKEIHYSFNGAEIIEGEAVPVEYINNIPSVDVHEVKHGRWLISWDGAIICSVCGEENPVHLMQNFPFCPYCGAEMDEKEEHEEVSFDEEEDDA